MSTSTLPYYQRLFYRTPEELKSKEPHYNFDKYCYYMLNVCEMCGQPVSGKELPAKGGKKKFSIMTDTTEYSRHDSWHCDRFHCKRYIIGTYAEYAMRCHNCGG